MRIVYTDKAIADLTRLRDFITQWNPRSAGRIAKELVARIKHLKRFPEMGKPVVEAPDPNAIRDFFFGRHTSCATPFTRTLSPYCASGIT